MAITSINLSTSPFLGSCDSTRAQMASKQMNQVLTHPNCEIPYTISNEYRKLVETSNLGILVAPDDGRVYYNNNAVMIVYYYNLKRIGVYSIPKHYACTGIFSSKLRFSLLSGTEFKKGDIVFSYDNFKNGIPTFGYNTMLGYFNFFGFEISSFHQQ